MTADAPHDANTPDPGPSQPARPPSGGSRKAPPSEGKRVAKEAKPEKATHAQPSRKGQQNKAEGARKPPPPPGIEEKRRLAIAKAKALRNQANSGATPKGEQVAGSNAKQATRNSGSKSEGISGKKFSGEKITPPAEMPASATGPSPKSGKSASSAGSTSKQFGSRRTPSERTIPQTYYQRMRARLAKRGLGQLANLALIGFFFALGLVWLWSVHSIQGTIIALNTTAWKNLQAANKLLDPEGVGVNSQRQSHVAEAQELRNQAREGFERAFELYVDRINPDYEWLWKHNPKLLPTMIQVAEGFQRLREIEPALETFRVLASRITEGENSWLWTSMREALNNFIFPDPNFDWNQEERGRLYQVLLQQNPKDWKLAEFEAVRMTEIVGIQNKPMAQRFAEADLALYGTPRPMHTENDPNLVVLAEIVYISDDDPGSVRLSIPPNLTEAERQRIFWYSQSGAHCLFFAHLNEEGDAVLAGIEGVLLSEMHTVPDFNRAVEQFEAEPETSAAAMTGSIPATAGE